MFLAVAWHAPAAGLEARLSHTGDRCHIRAGDSRWEEDEDEGEGGGSGGKGPEGPEPPRGEGGAGRRKIPGIDMSSLD